MFSHYTDTTSTVHTRMVEWIWNENVWVISYPSNVLLWRSCLLAFLPWTRVVAQLKHVRIILSQDGDCVTLLPDHKPRLLLVGIAKVDSIELEETEIHQTQKTTAKYKVVVQWLLYLKELVSVLQASLMCDAACCHFGHKHPPVISTHYGDPQRFCSLLNSHIARLLQVRPWGGKIEVSCSDTSGKLLLAGCNKQL